MTKASDTEVAIAIRKSRSQNPGVGVEKLVRLLHKGHPSWEDSVDVNRARELCKAFEEKSCIVSVSYASPNSLFGVSSPMNALLTLLHRICLGDDSKSSTRAAQLDMSLRFAPTPTCPFPSLFTTTDHTHHAPQYPMQSCKLTTTLALYLTSSNHLLPSCVDWSCGALSDLPLKNERSEDLRVHYSRARHRALAYGETTVLAVALGDLEMMVRWGGGGSLGTHFESFSHAFVVVIAPEGVRIIQAWGEHGYSLRENLESVSSSLRSFQEGTVYVNDYARLCQLRGGVWDQRVNDLYAKLFNVDLLHSTRPGGKMKRPIVPVFTAWTRVKAIQNVKINHVVRWANILDAIDVSFGMQ